MASNKPAAGNKVRKNKLGEDKRANFKSFATARTKRVLTALKALSNCGNKASYESTPAEIQQIENAIKAATEKCMNTLKSQPTVAKEEFKLQ